jgi:hypothetical protein
MAVENFLQILNFSFSGWKIPFPLEVERLDAGHGSQRRRKASLMVVAAVALTMAVKESPCRPEYHYVLTEHVPSLYEPCQCWDCFKWKRNEQVFKLAKMFQRCLTCFAKG